MTDLLKGLNQSQKQAVLHNSGPLLVFAGAGSGKTRVLTTRIARLIRDKIADPSTILAVTFTNKAAREMRERIASLVSAKAASVMTISTFHSFGAKILREDGKLLGLKPFFSILDENDRYSTLKNIHRTYCPANAKEGFDAFVTKVSLLKNASFDPESSQNNDDEIPARERRMYKAYQSTLLTRQSVDFDDLLLLPLRLFEQHPEALKKYRQRYQFICIDEYQDTNAVQMKLAALLAAPKNNLMVVGDDDQSIYSWRGANFENILHFAPLFKGCKTVILDTNYRSTRQILDGAYSVVSKNSKRKDKKIIAAKGDGEPIMHFRGDDEEEEALWIVQAIEDHVKSKTFYFCDHALLFRTNAMMQRFELGLRQAKIPYRIVGGMSFFDRKEVKDILAFLRFFSNPSDEISMQRFLKVPDKGISKSTIESLENLASLRKITLWEAFERFDSAQGIQAIQQEHCRIVVDLFKKYKPLFDSGKLGDTIRSLLTEASYFILMEKSYQETGDFQERKELVEEILHSLDTYEHKNARRKPSLAGFLQELALNKAEDDEENEGKNVVQMMTVHKAKGLEFPCVFLCGLDDSIFPSPRSIEEGNIEEERRLFYVAMTRAKRRLILTYPKTKVFRNKILNVNPSRFILDIPDEFLERPLGKKEDENKVEFIDDFFKQMKAKLATKEST